MRNQFQHDFQGGQWFRMQVVGNERKQAVFDLIPFAGGRRVMHHGDGELFFFSQVLQFLLPQAISDAVGPTPIDRISSACLLHLPNGIPSHDTFGHVFSLINPEQYEASFVQWVQGLTTTVKGVIASDGKTLCRSHDQAAGKKRCIW